MFISSRRFENLLRCAIWCSLVALLPACTAKPLFRPNGVAVAADGSLYVMDRGNYRIVHLTAEGRFLGAFGRLGTRPEHIHSGWDIALDEQGRIYICNLTFSESYDLLYDGVKVFMPNGKLWRETGRQDYTDSSTSGNRPYGLDVDRQGRVYIADFVANTLRVLDDQGQLIATLLGRVGSADGELNGPNDVAVDDGRNLLYVSDIANSRVQQFLIGVLPGGGLTLTHQLSIGGYGDTPGQFAYPQYLAVDDASGDWYVADLGNQRIQVFDSQGQYIRSLIPPDVHTWQVLGLAVGGDGAVYAADGLNNVIWAFEPDGSLRRRIEVK